jgi:hypothetical protein
MQDVQVGYVKSQQAALLATLMDQPRYQQHLVVEGTIPDTEEGDEYKLPLQVNLYWNNISTPVPAASDVMTAKETEEVARVVELLKYRPSF